MDLRVIWSPLGALFAITALFHSADLHAQQGRIEGVVVVGDSEVDDADVTIPGLGRRVRVDGAGRFTFDGVRPGSYVVEAQSVRWGRGVETVDVPAGGTVQLTILLEAVFHLDEMVISAGAGATRRSEAYQPASVMTSRDIVASGEASLGETLRNQPGVSSTYFGPGASRPVIRGIGGDRVRILEGGIGVGDASSTSPDHGVGVETRTAERIEVIRGPATLLYGSSAVGGVVNVLDGKIARERPTQPLTGHVELLGGTVSDERTGSASIRATAGSFVITGSGLWRDASDYEIPGAAAVNPGPGAEGGVLENSALESQRGGGGVTFVDNRGYIGVAVSAQRSEYGIPGGGEEGEESILIDLEQERIDVEGALRFDEGIFRNVKGRFGLTDYMHNELEGAEIGTQFFNDFVEVRVESENTLSERLHGAVGAQGTWREFEAIGDEAFVPPSETRTQALFAYEDFRASDVLSLQGGVRWERQTAESTTTGVERTDNAFSASLGANWDAGELFTIALSGSRSVKLPNAEELFSNGPHAATRAFEIGDPDLDAETALGVDLTVHVHGDRFRGSASAFTTGFSDYIYEAATGNQEDGLDEFVFTQDDARFSGFELEGEVDVLEGDPAANRPHLAVEVTSDFVRAELTDLDEDLPRIPPFRLGGGVNYRQGPIVARAHARYHASQDNIGPFETSTDSFTTLDASVSFRIVVGGLFHDITLTGTNLADTEARLHTSFLKDEAPLPGREIRLVYRLNFGG